MRRAAARARRRAGRLRLQWTSRRAGAETGCRETNICCGPGTTELARLVIISVHTCRQIGGYQS